MTGLGIYHYGARFYSPKLGRFLIADTIVPNVFNSQDLNRFSYVRNNPLRYTDPSGHFTCSNDKTSDDYCPGHSTSGSNPPVVKPPIGGGGGKPDKTKGGGKSNGSDFFSEVAYFADNVGVITSDIEVVVVDTMGAIVITEGCLTGVGCVPAIVYAAAIDIGVSSFSFLGLAENVAGVTALLATSLGDYFINETTYIHSNSNGGYDVGIGRDTVVSAVNFLTGLMPEANYDAWISHQQLEYDNQRRSGELPAVSLFEFHVPQPPNLWGTGWPNSLP